jgi:hypothetical protein
MEADLGIFQVRKIRIGRRRVIFIIIRTVLERSCENCQSKRKNLSKSTESGTEPVHFEFLIRSKFAVHEKDVTKLDKQNTQCNLRSGPWPLKKYEGDC